MQRNTFLKASIAGAVVLATGTMAACSKSDEGGAAKTGASASSGSTTLHVTMANHPWTTAVRAKIPEFEKQSGLKVVVEQLAEDQLTDTYKVKLNAGSKDMDVMMYRPLQEGRLFAQSGFLADLSSDVNQDKHWNWSDFLPATVSATTYKGKAVGVPLVTETQVIYYRKDLLQKAGLEPPKTLDELRAAAKKISEDNPGVAGFVARSGVSVGVTQFSSFLYSFGGDWFDKNDKSLIATPEAKAAYAYYGGMLRDYGPKPLNTSMSWPESAAVFAQGKAAFWADASSLYKQVADPKNSQVSDQVGYAAFPAGPAGAHAYSATSWAIGINNASDNKANAWKFIAWATSPEMTLEMQKAGNPCTRTSVWQNTDGTAGFPAPLVAAMNANAKGAVGYDRPVVVKVGQAREIVGKPFVVAMTGGDSNAAADQASAEFQKEILDAK
ncbi:MAG: sugar ABC transporter substrate-binding protein [Burkholderiaceae bacterium]|nr:MAG: sugar ABC transporter substrate-binding protein [Burkholderiaceae bacterium]